MCKIVVSIIKESIVNHINVNNLLNESQYGFVSKHSCLIVQSDIWAKVRMYSPPHELMCAWYKLSRYQIIDHIAMHQNQWQHYLTGKNAEKFKF